MNPWITLPQDVLDFVSAAFATANDAATQRLVNVPNVREGSLDDAFVEALIPNSAPTVLPSGTTVKMDIHNIGGLGRAGSWETADKGLNKGVAPSYAMVAASTSSDQRVEDWASELLACKAGRQFDQSDDEIVERLVVRRTGPIGAAILISIALPGD